MYLVIGTSSSKHVFAESTPKHVLAWSVNKNDIIKLFKECVQKVQAKRVEAKPTQSSLIIQRFKNGVTLQVVCLSSEPNSNRRYELLKKAIQL